MINEFGEEISDEDVKKIADRISKLPPKLIDELFFRCGFIYSDHGTNKALLPEYVGKIKSEKEKSSSIWALLAESHIKDVLENLDKIEKEAR